MDLYSRMVALLKVLLPLAALAILSTVFLLSRSVDPTATIPFAEQDMADRMRDQQVTAPFFSGTTSGGDEIMVTASIARPGGPNAPAEATDLSAQITMVDGMRITLRSDTGTVAVDKDLATFDGHVIITTTTGYVVLTDRLNSALSGITANTPGQIEGTGPLGEFTAGNMQIDTKTEGGPVHMLFKNGVKLIYDPKKT
ncbi:MAG: lipopolysaccharide export system protein LptC [Paracoccaceae bacterium]|jgi:lipopolysaccharide export system protein LptC